MRCAWRRGAGRIAGMVLPIVQRELRVAARRKGTHWARFLAAAWAMVIVLFLLLGDLFARRPQEAGHILFCILSGTALTFCILAGMFLSTGSRRGATIADLAIPRQRL